MPFDSRRKGYLKTNTSRWPAKRRRIRQEPAPAKEADIVGLDGSVTHFFSVKSAKRALASIIATLSPRKSPDEPKKFWLRKK